MNVKASLQTAVLALALAGCSSSNDGTSESTQSSGGSAGITGGTTASSTPPATSTASGGRANSSGLLIPPSTAAAGSTVTGPGNGLTAEQTTQGLYPISAAQATTILSDPATSCAGWADQAQLAQSVVEFIIDISGSMSQTTPATRGETKWSVTRTALIDAIGELPPELAVGMSFYPNMADITIDRASGTRTCIDPAKNLPIAPLTDTHFADLSFAVDMMQFFVQGATPTHDAYEVALNALRTDTNPGQKHLVLITDGQPTLAKGCIGDGQTCPPQPTEPIIATIGAALQQDQVKTFIVGSPGSELNECSDKDLRSWLSAAARAGGTAPAGCSDSGPNYCHFDLTQASDFGAALSSALGTIAKSVVACDYTVPAVGAKQEIDTNRVNMIYDDGAGSYSLVLPSKGAACEKGWQFTDASLKEIHVCPETCALLQNNPKAKVSLVFGCTQEQLQNPII
ncbi:MAG TPA: vWA domain-containing protein [Polyangiaceae bacterium]|nr:vWA domain-containing protein [Polyangiaceae bacterium]